MKSLALIQNKLRRLAQGVLVNTDDRDIRASILKSLRSQYLPMAFQPIIDHSRKYVFAHESLSRPTVGGISTYPDHWFRVAHEYGYGPRTDLLAVHSAITESSIGSRQNNKQLLFVNIMPSSLTSCSFTAKLESIFSTGLCESRQLVFEITEHIPYDPVALVDVIRLLREMGVRFALDDVGLGASNLSSIVELEPDFIKIDRTLIGGISSSASKHKMVSQLVQYMGSGDRVIAEGIENIDDLDAVRQTGINLSQGYFWGHPQPFPLVATTKQLFGNLDVLSKMDKNICESPSPFVKSLHGHGTVQSYNGKIIISDPQQL